MVRGDPGTESPRFRLSSNGRAVGTFLLPFWRTEAMNRHAQNTRRKGTRNNMTNAETNDKAPTVAEQGVHDAPRKPPSKKAATQKKGAPKGRKTAKGAKAKAAAPKKAAKVSGKERKVAAPRPESKGAKILALIGRPKGASLSEIMKATGWQAHSVRGFLSKAAKKRKIRIESVKNESGDRIYTIAT
jgi:hypothetical protein